MFALLLINILIFSKKSTIKKSAIKDKNVMVKNLENSLNMYLSKILNLSSSFIPESVYIEEIYSRDKRNLSVGRIKKKNSS